MHSFWLRGGFVLSFAVTVLFVTTLGCALSSFFYNPTPWAKITDHHVINLLPMQIQRPAVQLDQARLSVDVSGDLRSVWNWNVQQVFLYVLAEYETSAHALNQVVLWDRIITTVEDSQFTLPNQLVEYALNDHARELRGRDVRLSVHWDVMPIAGTLYSGRSDDYKVTLPDEYQH